MNASTIPLWGRVGLAVRVGKKEGVGIFSGVQLVLNPGGLKEGSEGI
jgi:hypothetical protein